MAAAAVAACVVLVLSVGGGAPARRASLAIVAEVSRVHASSRLICPSPSLVLALLREAG